MRKLLFATALIASVLLAAPVWATDVFVDDDFDASTPGWGTTHFDAIQDGIDAVGSTTVNVADGTYTIATTLNVNKTVTIDGESEAGVILDASGCAGYGMLVTAGSVVLRDMTMLPPAVNYPIHASGTGNPPGGYDGLTIEYMTIEGVHQRTAFDIHGYSNVVLSYLTAGDATGGNGIQVTGCLTVDMDNITTHDNAWGSIAIYVSKSSYLNRGSDDVDIDGDSCTLGEGNIYSQDEDGLTNTNVAVAGYEYLVKNDTAIPGYDLFQDTLTDAATVAAAVGAGSYITEIATGDLVVVSGMSIQDAIDAADPGDTIEVAAGTYAERLTITAPIDLRGAQYGVDPTLGGRTNPAAESTIDITGIGVANPNVAVELTSGATGASVAGFTVIGSPTVNYADETVFRAWCGDLTIEDNIIDGYFGVLHKGGSNVSISRNLITINKGAITLQPGTYDSFTIDGNVAALGTSPDGGESAVYMTSASNIDVTGNIFTGFPNGNGVGGSSNTSITIIGNDLSSNRKGVNFWGNTTFVDVADNDIKNCTNAGVNIKGQDLTVTGNVFAGCDVGFDVGVHTLTTERVTATDNDFSGCIMFGIQVVSTVSEIVDASGNYWGTTDPWAVQQVANSGLDIDYTPWLGGGTALSPGFVGDLATLHVGAEGEQTGGIGRIQEGIDLVSGSTVHLSWGTFNERPVVNKSVTIIGAGEGSTTIDAGAGAIGGSYGFTVNSDDVAISDFTLLGDVGLSTPRYGFKIAHVSNFTMTDVTATEFYRTGVDFLNVTNGTATRVTSFDNGGHGLALVDCNGVDVTDLDVSGNGWQGVSVATWGRYSALGVSDIVFAGTNNFADPFQLEMGDYNNPGVPPAGDAIITYSVNIGDGADVTVQSGDLAFAVHGEQDDAPDQARIWLAPDLASAQMLPAMAPIGHFTGNDMYIESLTDPTQLYCSPGCEIQEAVDIASGGYTINVAAGTYDEMLSVSKSLTFLGANAGIHPAIGTHPTEVVGTRVAESILSHNGLYAMHPSADDITVDGFTFSGDGGRIIDTYDDANGFHLTNCIFENDATGTSQGVIQFGGGSHTDCLFDFNLFQDDGDHTLYTGGGPWDGLRIEYNKFNVEGDAVFWTATPLVDGVIKGNEFDGTIGGTPGVGFCTVNIGQGGNIRVEDNYVHDVQYTAFQVGIIGGSVTGNTFERIYPYPTYWASGFELWGGQWGTAVSSNVDVSDNVFHINDIVGAAEPSHGLRLRGPENVGDPEIDGTTIVCRNNMFLDGGEHPDCLGIWHQGDPAAYVDAELNWWGDPSGPYHLTDNPTGAGANVGDYVDFSPWMTGNIYCDPDPEYLSVAGPTKTIDVDYLGGGGGMMYGYDVTFTWDTALVNMISITQGDLLSGGVVGTTFWSTNVGTGTATVNCIQLGAQPGVTGPGTMFSIEFTGTSFGTSPIDITVNRVRDSANQTLTGFFEDDGELIVDVDAPFISMQNTQNASLPHTDSWIKDTDWAVVTCVVTDDDPAFGIANIWADLTGLGGGASVNPDTYDGWLATWVIYGVTCTPQDGQAFVYVDATDPMGNPGLQGADSITADNTAPTAVVDFDAAPGNGECVLTWTLGTDLYLGGVAIQRASDAGEYPEYPTFVGDWPTVNGYPGDESEGTNVFFNYASTHTDVVVDRNIYYYQAFCYDHARNYGPAATTARDLATNYWLGDVSDGWGTWGGDGLVDVQDILKLSGAYGQAPVDYNAATCDVGPTVHPDWHRLGLPMPDDMVEFEDAMVFAMNYGVVTARVVPFLPEEHNGDVLALTLEERGVAGNEVEIALTLEGNTGDVKGMSAAVAYDPSQLEFVSARLTEDMSSPLADVFFWSGDRDGRVLVDATVLGTGVTIGGSGDVATLTFRMVGDGYVLDIESARIRNADNVELDAKLGDLESGGETPLAFRLVQNAPNPFNPVTKVAYHVPSKSDVTIRVYDVSGRVVRTLVDGVVDPGRHVAVWDGRNDAGETVGSGIYFCTMEAPEFHDSRKMTLLK